MGQLYINTLSRTVIGVILKDLSSENCWEGRYGTPPPLVQLKHHM